MRILLACMCTCVLDTYGGQRWCQIPETYHCVLWKIFSGDHFLRKWPLTLSHLPPTQGKSQKDQVCLSVCFLFFCHSWNGTWHLVGPQGLCRGLSAWQASMWNVTSVWKIMKICIKSQHRAYKPGKLPVSFPKLLFLFFIVPMMSWASFISVLYPWCLGYPSFVCCTHDALGVLHFCTVPMMPCVPLIRRRLPITRCRIGTKMQYSGPPSCPDTPVKARWWEPGVGIGE